MDVNIVLFDDFETLDAFWPGRSIRKIAGTFSPPVFVCVGRCDKQHTRGKGLDRLSDLRKKSKEFYWFREAKGPEDFCGRTREP